LIGHRLWANLPALIDPKKKLTAFRVKDVLYKLQGAPGRQACILLDEETEVGWPD
jgi:hypothetical protein